MEVILEYFYYGVLIPEITNNFWIPNLYFVRNLIRFLGRLRLTIKYTVQVTGLVIPNVGIVAPSWAFLLLRGCFIGHLGGGGGR